MELTLVWKKLTIVLKLSTPGLSTVLLCVLLL